VKDPKQLFDGLGGLSVQAALNQPKQLEQLLRSTRDSSARDPDGDRTPLHWAAARGYMKCCEVLCQAGADLSAADSEGRTPSVLATQLGQAATATFLRKAARVRALRERGRATPHERGRATPHASLQAATAGRGAMK